MSKGKVIVGMSGGVDSTVAAYLLKEQGYDVIGVTMEMWPGEGSQKAIEDASRVAKAIGIPFEVLDFQKEFRACVVNDFMEQYQKGLTPNPCIVCNRLVKGQALLDKAHEMGAEHIATGHYARIEKHPKTGRYAVRNSATAVKDQTYALYRLTQEQLQAMLLPIGEYSKEEVRQIAEKIDGFVAKKGDSQDICFIPDGDYAAFIEREGGYKGKPGDFVDMNGKVVGKHKGLIHYTVGQRKGLGAFGKPMFVLKIDSENGNIVLGEKGTEFSDSLLAEKLNFISVEKAKDNMKVFAKVRYSAKPAPAELFVLDEEIVKVVFDTPQRAITPGQAVVFYSEDKSVIGGGIIK